MEKIIHNNPLDYSLTVEEAWAMRLRYLKQQLQIWRDRFEDLTNYQIRFPEMGWYFDEEISNLARKINGRERFLSQKPENRTQELDLDALKAIPIKDVLDSLGVRESKPRWYKCLWHNDSNPSLYLYPKQNRVKCFSCGKLGSNIDVIMAVENKTCAQAIQYLKKLL